ncbi:head maturation protease, ClpP-related [Aestuariibius insulae]|uniref:head maturation protease, ClpP-related n=1 Tax=Aestuariibius insulae TaxID=2058287 RepID=UPI00345E0ACA
MSLRDLPEFKAERLTEICAFELDTDALSNWNAGLSVRSADDETSISILDVIGEDPWTGGGVTSKRIAAALRSIGDRDVTVNLNSPGGDFFEGVAIYNMLRAHPHRVSVRILGLAASAGSVIAMAGDDIAIGKAGFMMVHNCWVMAIGNRHDLAEAAKTMEPFDDAMAGVYAERSGVKRAEAAGWMDAETWFNGEQAVEAGLADGFLPADMVSENEMQAETMRNVNAVRRIDALLAKSGLPRTERRALLSEAKGGTPSAAPTVMQDADEIAALLKGLSTTLTK